MGEQAHAMRSVVVLAAVVVAAPVVEALANDPPEADGMGAPGAGVTTTTDISSVTASNFYDPDRDMTEGEGARIQEFLVHMEGAQQQLNGQDVLSISEIAYSTENGCENPISVALNTVMEREL